MGQLSEFAGRHFTVCTAENNNQSEVKLIKIIIQKWCFFQRYYYRTIKEAAMQTWCILLKAVFLYSEPSGLEIRTRMGQKTDSDL